MNRLINYLNKSYTAFHAVKNIEEIFKENGFNKLEENQKWNILPNSSYYIIRNASSIIAFKTPKNINDVSFNIVASHSDSPCFKLKPNVEIKDGRNEYTKLNVEPYGGMIAYTWLDRPLGIAGRIFIEEEDGVKELLVNFDETVTIPSVAIHLNRKNEFAPNPQIDLLPLFGGTSKSFEEVMKKYTNNQEIISFDLFVYNKEEAYLYGANNEYLASARLDDLECAYTSAMSLINSNPKNISVCAIFNNEEVGSRSNNGAASTLLKDVLERVATSLEIDMYTSLSNSFIVSADNGHAVHPNHPELSDSTNSVHMNKGIVIKHQAGLSYTTDALSEAVFKKICKMSNVPFQDYTNRSDQRGGSTLGAISLGQISISSVDIGFPQLAMHSSIETAGTQDVLYMLDVLKKYYEVQVLKEENSYKIK